MAVTLRQPDQLSPGATVTLPDDLALPPGSYEIVIRGQGEEWTLPGIVPARIEDRATNAAPAEPGPNVPVVGVAVAVIVTASLWLARRVLVQRRRLDGYHRAIGLIERGRHSEALPELTGMEAVLPARLRWDARFFVAYALYRSGELDEADLRLAALNRERPHDEHTAQLLAHLRVERDDHDGAEAVLDALEARAGIMTDSCRRLHGLVKFQRAMNAFRDGRIGGATDLFEKVAQLGDYRDEIPTGLRNRHIVLGTRALLLRDMTRARQHFDDLLHDLGDERGDEADALRGSARLGLALASWIEDTAPALARAESLLADAIATVNPADAALRDWPADVSSKIAERLEAAGDDESAHSWSRDRFVRDAQFVRGLALLRLWNGDEHDDRLVRAYGCFAAARSRHPSFSDVHVVVGLLRYRLSVTAAEREAAVEILREARRLGARDPELLGLIASHDRLLHRRHDPLDDLLLQDLADRDQELVDPDTDDTRPIPARDRRDPRPPGRRAFHLVPPEPGALADSSPTLAERNERAELLIERARHLREAPGDPPVQRSIIALDEARRELIRAARATDESESRLLSLLGDRLFPEDGSGAP